MYIIIGLSRCVSQNNIINNMKSVFKTSFGMILIKKNFLIAIGKEDLAFSVWGLPHKHEDVSWITSIHTQARQRSGNLQPQF